MPNDNNEPPVVHVESFTSMIVQTLGHGEWSEGDEWDEYVAPPCPDVPDNRVPWLHSITPTSPQWLHDCLRARPGYRDDTFCPGDAMIVHMVIEITTDSGRDFVMAAGRMGDWKWRLDNDRWEWEHD